MSGGHFDHGCFRISQFADDLLAEIEENKDWDYSEETLVRLRVAHKIIVSAGKLAHIIEWLYSDDYGEEGACKRIDKILGDVDD